MKSRDVLRVAASATVSVLVFWPQATFAQSSSGSTPQSLPSVVVTSPEKRSASTTTRSARRLAAQSATASRRPQPKREATTIVENPRGAVQGYVAGRSMAGTKTNTPIMQTPQSLSVMGSEQIRDQKPGKFDEILRYTPGVVAGTFGADTRNDWFLIRGFKSDDIGLFLDGLQLFYTSYASWKLPPFNLERVEVLRGPSAVLYGGSSPSGIVNAVSKMPPAEPIRYIETGVNNFSNAYLSFDDGGPVATAPGNGQLFYRVVGQVQNGGTQVDFTPDNNYFIAPSVTYKPDADTTFTVLASASKTDTRGINFLPYAGTVVNAPFGRIPTKLFVGDPSVDKFTREQEMIGYQFERNLTDNVTFRQNARYAHVDLAYRGFIGSGYTNITTGDIGRYNWYAKNTANQGNLDNQLEYRFDTGPVQHTMLFGLDLKNYRIDDYAEVMLSQWKANELADMVRPYAGKPPPVHIASLDTMLEKAGIIAPNMNVSFVAFPGTPFTSSHHFAVFMRGHTPLTSRLLKPVLLDGETGDVSDARDLPVYLKALLVSQPLHFGDYGGMPLKIIWALLDIMTIVVIGSGLYLWIVKRRKHRGHAIAGQPLLQPSE